MTITGMIGGVSELSLAVDAFAVSKPIEKEMSGSGAIHKSTAGMLI
jgi:hypothetical protein